MHYRNLASLSEYLLVSQTECRIERYSRQSGDTWLYSECADPNGSIELTSVAAHLTASSVYHKVDFERAKSKLKGR
jgi:Uma2 family endonuclease